MGKNRWSVELGHGLGDIELGALRGDLLEQLRDAGIEWEADADDPHHVDVAEMELQLTFHDGDPPRLIQIAVQDERVQFGSQPVIGCRLHKLTTLLDVRQDETVWRIDDDPDDSLASDAPSPRAPAADLDLLESGTLWIRPLGLGLDLWRGEIREVYLRQPEHVPTTGQGRLTTKQLDWSRREDLAGAFGNAHSPEARTRRRFRFIAGATLFALTGAIVWQAATHQRRWHAAPTVEAEVIAAGPGGPETIPTDFVVSYRDHNGVEHQASVGLADVYVPRAVGEKVELRYLPEEPGRPLGPSRAKDEAFSRFFPWVIAGLVGYLVVLICEAVVWRLTRGQADPPA